MNVVRYLFVLLLATAFCILLVAQQTCVLHLGYSISRLETERDTLSEQNRRLVCEISALSHPARIAGEVERMNIALLDPVSLTQQSMGEGPGASSAASSASHAPRRVR